LLVSRHIGDCFALCVSLIENELKKQQVTGMNLKKQQETTSTACASTRPVHSNTAYAPANQINSLAFESHNFDSFRLCYASQEVECKRS
jgi:hypothetical protein